MTDIGRGSRGATTLTTTKRSGMAALAALAAGGFSIGLTEFAVVGLLPSISHDLSVSATTASTLVSGYAISVAAGAIALTIATIRLPPKPVLVVLMMLFIIGNIVSGIGPNFSAILLGRIIAALCHGTFFGVGAVLATTIVPKGKQAQAISIMFGGLTLANVLGVPFGTFIAQHFGWRWTFLIIAAVGIVAWSGVAILVPKGAGTQRTVPPLRAQFKAFRGVQVWLSLLLTICGFGGIFGSFTYIPFTLTNVSNFPADVVPILLVMFGGGLFIGNLLGGRLADRRLFLSLLILLAALAADLLVYGVSATDPVMSITCLILMGFFGFATVPGLQLRTQRSDANGSRLTSAANIAAFNIGNALGAWLCGLGIEPHGNYTSPLFIGAAITGAAITVLLVATGLEVMSSRRPSGPAAAEKESSGAD